MACRPADLGVQQLWAQLEDEEHSIVAERRRLQDIWRKISAMHKKNAEDRDAFEKKCAFDFVSADEQITLNVGGHRFQTTAGVLCRDRFSLLACACKTTPPIFKDEDGAFFFERDWWIFRYVLQFLRTGDLPQDQALLQEMYGEAAFYRLNSLRRAIQRRAAATTAIMGGTMFPTSGATSPLSHGPTAASVPRRPTPLQDPTGITAAEGTGRLYPQQQPQPARARSLYREPLPDPYGFIRKGS